MLFEFRFCFSSLSLNETGWRVLGVEQATSFEFGHYLLNVAQLIGLYYGPPASRKHFC